jgi:ribosomal protein S19
MVLLVQLVKLEWQEKMDLMVILAEMVCVGLLVYKGKRVIKVKRD